MAFKGALPGGDINALIEKGAVIVQCEQAKQKPQSYDKPGHPIVALHGYHLYSILVGSSRPSARNKLGRVFENLTRGGLPDRCITMF